MVFPPVFFIIITRGIWHKTVKHKCVFVGVYVIRHILIFSLTLESCPKKMRRMRLVLIFFDAQFQFLLCLLPEQHPSQSQLTIFTCTMFFVQVITNIPSDSENLLGRKCQKIQKQLLPLHHFQMSLLWLSLFHLVLNH